MVDLKAKPGGCEETSMMSASFYIPCDQPAVRLVFHARDNKTYRMCAMCADHNIRNRGGKDKGEYNGQPE